MSRWFTSDLHLGDPYMAKRRYCGDDVAKHDAWLAKRWDAVVQPRDEVWVLGDVVNGMSKARFALWLQKRPGFKHLVIGNWDEEMTSDLRVWQALGFSSAQFTALITLSNGQTARLTHAPQRVEPGDPVVLHGHTHRPAKTSPVGIHVGWDAWRRYAREDDIIALLDREKENVHE